MHSDLCTMFKSSTTQLRLDSSSSCGETEVILDIFYFFRVKSE